MDFIYGFITGAVIVAVVAVFVIRNNQKKFNEYASAAERMVEQLKAKIGK
jgi:gas vesicle protein